VTLPFMPFYVSDWLGETAHLSDTECGVLIRLWCQMWRNGERTGDPSLADDDRFVARLLGCTTARWRRLKQSLTEGENAPILIENSRLFSQVVLRAFEKLHRKRLSQVEAARRTNQKLARSATDTVTETVTDTVSGDTRARPRYQIPDTRCQIPEPDVSHGDTFPVSMFTGSEIQTCAFLPENEVRENGAETAVVVIEPTVPARSNGRRQYPLEFEQFWEAYPIERRKGKDDAFAAWEKRRKARELPGIETLCESIEAHLEHDPDWSRDNLRFVPLPAKYLNGGRWLDSLGPHTRRPDPLKQALAEGR